VTEVGDDVAVEPNHVYVIPPNTHLTIEHGHLRLIRPATPRLHDGLIDEFLLSLARDQGGERRLRHPVRHGQ
ncbi:MAG TPA: chemotaxis protein CheB, partial [Rhodopila sp.]|nr:chemotaxis protein CheB [Rhodopila sp.]